MKLNQLFALATGFRGPIYAGRISRPLQRAMEAHTGAVWLSAYTLGKQLAKHPDITFEHYLQIPLALKYGAAVIDKPGSMMLIYRDQYVFQATFRLAIQRTGCGNEIYVKSFHTMRRKSANACLRKHPLIRPHEGEDGA